MLLVPGDMKTELKKELREIAKAIGKRRTRFVGTREIREKLSPILDGVVAENVMVMDHGRPRAVVLDPETYKLFLKMAHLITFEVAEVETENVSDAEFQAMEMKREDRRPRRLARA